LEDNYRWYLGIDWATQAHQVCTISPDRRIVDQRIVEHSGLAIAGFVEWLADLTGGEPGSAAIAIETPRGAIVEGLIERGFHVYAINPKQLDRFRDRHTVAGSKDDRRDAFVLADSLRTDRPCFRLVQADDPIIVELREVARIDDDLREDANRLTNRLREQLHRYFPQMLQVCPSADEPWLWALVERVSRPEQVKGLRTTHVQKILRTHRIRRVTADEILVALKAPPLRVAVGTVEAATAHIALLLPRVRLVHQQRAECARRIETLLAALPYEDASGQKVEHRDVDILRSLPGAGRVISATVFAEASLPLKERDYHAFRALAGVAPVTKQTGKEGQPGSGRKVMVQMRHACSGRLRNAMYHWARVSSQIDEVSRAYYAAMRKRGHSHGRALRGTADRLLRILFAMLRSRTLYQPGFIRPGAPTAMPAAVAAK
jgi:transposase